MTKLINAALILFGLMCIGMGIQAAFFPHEGVKASMVSLYAAGGLGALVLVSVFVWTKNPRFGRIMSLVLALLAVGRFAPKFFKEQQMYPAGITFFAAAIVIVLLLAGHFQGMKERKSGSE